MSKKGVDALTKAPTWLKVLINPAILEHHRALQIKAYALQKERILALEQVAIQQGSDNKTSHLFALKQLGGHYHCDITQENFPKGHEKEWIQFVKTLDNEDLDPSHANQEYIRREIQNKTSSQAKDVIDKISQEDTKDGQAHTPREINQAFPEYLLNSLEKSPSQSLIIKLLNSKNETEPLALVLLKGQNGLWLHDPKLKCTIDFNPTNTTSFKQFLMEHIKVNHPEFNKAFIIQLGNKEKFRLSHKEVPKDAKHLFQEKEPQIVKSFDKDHQAQEDSNKEEYHKPTKPKL